LSGSRQIHFRSSRFAVEPGEDQQTNPGIFGRALAAWLAEQLPARGWRTKRCIAEDFGWVVEVEHERFRAFVACASGHDGEHSWQAFAFVEGGGIRGLFAGAEKLRLADKLLADVELVLREDPYTQEIHAEGAS
jgi:hypothetical protein